MFTNHRHVKAQSGQNIFSSGPRNIILFFKYGQLVCDKNNMSSDILHACQELWQQYHLRTCEDTLISSALNRNRINVYAFCKLRLFILRFNSHNELLVKQFCSTYLFCAEGQWEHFITMKVFILENVDNSIQACTCSCKSYIYYILLSHLLKKQDKPQKYFFTFIYHIYACNVRYSGEFLLKIKGLPYIYISCL